MEFFYIDGLFDFFFFQAEDGIRDLTVTGVQTCALPISRHLGEEIVYRAPPLRVAAADDIADGLVEREPGDRAGAHGPAVDSDALPPGVDAHAERRDLAVHAHAARANQLLGLAPRRHARARQGALQAHHRHSGSVGAGGRSATDNSSSRGSSSRSLSPRIWTSCLGWRSRSEEHTSELQSQS